MENNMDEDDEQWLSALAGRFDPSGDAKTNLQAQALRRALQARAEKLEAKVPFADEDQYQKLLLRLQREKLLAGKSGWRNSAAWIKTTGALGLSADVIPWKSPVILGLTATLVIGIAVAIKVQNSATEKSEVEIMRLRGTNATTQIVEEPEVRLAELVQGLRTIGEDPVIERISNGSIVLTLNANPKVLEYLETPPNRISPSIVDGKVTLLLMRPKSTPKPN
jgi:hypothetical protein